MAKSEIKFLEMIKEVIKTEYKTNFGKINTIGFFAMIVVAVLARIDNSIKMIVYATFLKKECTEVSYLVSIAPAFIVLIVCLGFTGWIVYYDKKIKAISSKFKE